MSTVEYKKEILNYIEKEINIKRELVKSDMIKYGHFLDEIAGMRNIKDYIARL